MEKDKLEGLLIDYIDGKLNDEEAKVVEQELSQNEEAGRLFAQLKVVMTALDKSPAWEPSISLKRKFDQALQNEITGNQRTTSGSQVFFNPVVYRAAAAVVLVMISAGLGYWGIKTQQQQSELEALRKEMDATRRVMMTMLDDQQSASTRVKGATAAYNMVKTDDQIVKALVRTLNEDPNTNVRLAALEALGKFNQESHVRKELVASLATQKDPIVQIALIQLMVRMKEKGAIKDLEQIVNDDETMKAVKDEAYSGLLKLS
jgi:anti-sigma factor RsiW